MNGIEESVRELAPTHVRGRLRLVSGPQGPRVLLDGKPVLLLCSNNYLGLADHPDVRAAAADAAMRWGVGACSSRLVSGSMTIHRRLEERLARFTGSEACVLFGSGYLAVLGVLGALAGPGDVVFCDELSEPSILDGCRLGEAQVVMYRHCDVDHLAWCMRAHRDEGERFIATESLFATEADVAPLEEILELADAHDARVIVDESHAIGALGPGGRGAVADAGLAEHVDMLVGTLGNALGSYGGYACAREDTIQHLIEAARPLASSSAPAPPAVAAALAALELVESRPHRVERLRLAARTLRTALADEGFAVPESELQIVPLLIGDARLASALADASIERGLFVEATAPVASAPQDACLRLTVMASHNARELRAAARALARLVSEHGIDPLNIGSPELAQSSLEDASLDPSMEGLEAGAVPIHGAEPGGSLRGREVEEVSETAELEAVAEPLDSAPLAPFDLEREGGLREAA